MCVVQVTSPDRLNNDWADAPDDCHANSILSVLPASASIVTVLDGHPAALSWLGSVHGHRVRPLGVNQFGQSGDIPDLYEHYQVSKDAIVRACGTTA